MNTVSLTPCFSAVAALRERLSLKFHSRITPAMGATGVAQIYNLLYRRIAFGKPLELREAGGLQIRDTAECNSARRPPQTATACEICELSPINILASGGKAVKTAETFSEFRITGLKPRC
jgi:hypothetical protein